MILQIDAKSFSVFRGEDKNFSQISIVSTDVRKSQEDLEHVIAFLLESYPRDQIKTELKNVDLIGDE